MNPIIPLTGTILTHLKKESVNLKGKAMKIRESERQNLIVFTQTCLEKRFFPIGHGLLFDAIKQQAMDIASRLTEQLFEF